MNLYNESRAEIICILLRQVLITQNDLRLTIPQSPECWKLFYNLQRDVRYHIYQLREIGYHCSLLN